MSSCRSAKELKPGMSIGRVPVMAMGRKRTMGMMMRAHAGSQGPGSGTGVEVRVSGAGVCGDAGDAFMSEG